MNYSVQKRPHVAYGQRCGDPLQLSMTYFCCPEVVTLSDCARFSAEGVQHLIGNSVPEHCSKVMRPLYARFGHGVGGARAHVIKQGPPARSGKSKCTQLALGLVALLAASKIGITNLQQPYVCWSRLTKQLTTRCGSSLHVEGLSSKQDP